MKSVFVAHRRAESASFAGSKTVFGRKFLFSTALLTLAAAMPASKAMSATVNADSTLYFYGVNVGDSVIVNTTVDMKTAPLQGFGVYMQTNGANRYVLEDVTINTTGKQADAIRTNSEATFFMLKI